MLACVCVCYVCISVDATKALQVDVRSLNSHSQTYRAST